jgi:HSP20 family protein
MWTRSPFDDLFNVFRDFDNLFRRTFADMAPALSEGRRALTSGGAGERAMAPATGGMIAPFRWGSFPAVESYSKDGKLYLRAELPGVDPNDVQVSVTGETLTISGEKKASREVEESDVSFRETTHGRFERSFALPEGVKGEQVKARYENGVLELTMPFPEETRPRKIDIEVAHGGRAAKAA